MLKGAQRPPPSSSSSSSSSGRGSAFTVGQRIEANFRGEGGWFPARVAAVRGDGALDLIYDDGDREESVAAHRARAYSYI